jgi:hypothetical protein
VLVRDAAENAEARAFSERRLFLLACAELFGFRDGTEWRLAHVRMCLR